jgi:hypothetical protein
MTTSTEELRARVRQLNFPTEDPAGPDGHRVATNPGGSLSARAQRPRPTLGLGPGEPFAMGSPVARRPTPHTLNLGVRAVLYTYYKLSPNGYFPSILIRYIWP